MRTRFELAGLFVLVMQGLLSTSCSSPLGAVGCVPGQVVECPCPGAGSGVQTCSAARTYGACNCGGSVPMADASTMDATTMDVAVPPRDAGGKDTGVTPPVDGFTPPADTGVTPPTDTGVTPPVDVFTPPTDTGVTPPVDVFTPPTDTGVTPPVDAGASSAPTNDTFAGATVLDLGSPVVRVTGTTVGATAQGGCGAGGDVYYRFTVVRREIIALSTFGSSYNTTLGFSGADGRVPATSCVDDGCPGLLQEGTVLVFEPGTYVVVVGGARAGGGAFALELRHLPAGNGPAAPLAVTGASTTLRGTTSGTSGYTPSCGVGAGPESAWYFATCPASQVTDFDVSTCGGATWDTVLEYRAAGSPTAICNDDNCLTQSRITGSFAAGFDLHVFYVDGYASTDQGDYALTVTFPGATAADAGAPVDTGACSSGTTLCGGACVALTTTANCGACGRACTSGQTCSGGACVSPCPAGMAYIPAGSFLMGDADTLSNGAQPPHMVTLSAYCMDLTEVTVAAYRGCTAPGCTTPSTGTYFNWGVAGRDNHPINGVDWNQSRAYCQWRGVDLPTEAQWEYAARGSDVTNHIYPWGNAAPASQLCWNRYPTPGSTCPVQSYPLGNSPFGLFDMAGNVIEWTRDFYANYPSAAASDPTGPTSGASRVLRGGAWNDSASVVRAAYRFDGRSPTYRDGSTGFRCARSLLMP